MQIRRSYPVSLTVQSSFAGPTLFMLEYDGATCFASLLHSFQSDTGSIPSIWIYSLHYFTLRNFFELLAQRRVKLFFETLETLFPFLLLIVYLKLSYSLLQRRAGDVGTYLHKSTYALLAS